MPTWVPANARIHIDFVGGLPQGRAWVRDVGEVAVSDLLGNDSNAVNFQTTAYAPEFGLTADGYDTTLVASRPAFIGALRDIVFAAGGSTIVAKFKQSHETLGQWAIIFMAPDMQDAIQFDGNPNTGKTYGYSYQGSASFESGAILNTGQGEINIFAMTVIPSAGGRIDMSVNGDAPMSAPLDATDCPSGNPLIAAVFDYTQAYQSITVYDALPDTDGLSALSTPD